jgi:hypothetical protein
MPEEGIEPTSESPRTGFLELLALQPRQPLPGILDFGQAGVGIFPDVEEELQKIPTTTGLRRSARSKTTTHCSALYAEKR